MALKEILGHSSMEMVERYAHLAAAHKKKQINNLSGLFKLDRQSNATKTETADLSKNIKAL